MLLRKVPSLLYASPRLGSCVIISLHAFLHAILDQSSRVWRAQLSSLSFNSIHSITHNAIKSFIMSSAAPTPSNPYRVTPASSKAASSIRSGRVVLHPPEAIDASVHRTSVTLTPRSLGNTTTTTSTSSGPLQPHRSPSRHRLLKSSPLPPIQSTPVELNHPTPLP